MTRFALPSSTTRALSARPAAYAVHADPAHSLRIAARRSLPRMGDSAAGVRRTVDACAGFMWSRGWNRRALDGSRAQSRPRGTPANAMPNTTLARARDGHKEPPVRLRCLNLLPTPSIHPFGPSTLKGHDAVKLLRCPSRVVTVIRVRCRRERARRAADTAFG